VIPTQIQKYISLRQTQPAITTKKPCPTHICCLLAFVVAAAIAMPAQTLTTLAEFDGANGAFPYYGSLVQGSNGSYYGTTLLGGATFNGTVFEITTSGALTTLYSFCSQTNCADGQGPYGGLALGFGENLYGTTINGGANDEGTVFQITPTGTLTTLYNFCSQANCSDGGAPVAGLVSASNGDLYGTTLFGGKYDSGTVFQLTPAGKLTTLYSFCSKANCTDGYDVQSPLVRSSNGKYYGVTFGGGANGWGTVFDVTTTGKFSTLHSFAFTDGANPWGGLVQADDGDLYGTTEDGGSSNNGTVFRITETGKFATIYNFCVKLYCTDGSIPAGTLTRATSSSLYGTTASGGTGHLGTVFEITTTGVLTTLHSFAGADGAAPYAGVVANGDLYGTTYGGGDLNCTNPPGGCGTVFSLTQQPRKE
jgi:uncharacterized repeat protein (TIGR03803 family)